MLRGAFAPLAGTVQRSLHSSFQDVVGKGTFPGLHYEIRGFTAGLRVLLSPEFVFALALSPLDAVSRYNLSCPPACPASQHQQMKLSINDHKPQTIQAITPRLKHLEK